MFNIQVIAGLLLLIRLGAVGFMIFVLRKQWKKIKENNPPHIQNTRVLLFALSSIIFAGNFVPILIDAASILELYPTRPDIPALGVSYAFSNAITALASAMLLFALYREQTSSGISETPEEAKADDVAEAEAQANK